MMMMMMITIIIIGDLPVSILSAVATTAMVVMMMIVAISVPSGALLAGQAHAGCGDLQLQHVGLPGKHLEQGAPWWEL